MSFSVRVQLYDGNSSRPKQYLVPWWNKDELMKQYPFHGVYDEGYFEYFLEVNKNELQQIYDEQSVHICEGKYADEEERELILPLAERIKKLIHSDTSYKSIQVNVFEWD